MSTRVARRIVTRRSRDFRRNGSLAGLPCGTVPARKHDAGGTRPIILLGKRSKKEGKNETTNEWGERPGKERERLHAGVRRRKKSSY